jgi:hypothetical protein
MPSSLGTSCPESPRRPAVMKSRASQNLSYTDNFL